MSSREISLCVHLAGEMVEIGKIHLVDDEHAVDEYAVIIPRDGSNLGKLIDAHLGRLIDQTKIKEINRRQIVESMTNNLYNTMFGKEYDA